MSYLKPLSKTIIATTLMLSILFGSFSEFVFADDENLIVIIGKRIKRFDPGNWGDLWGSNKATFSAAGAASALLGFGKGKENEHCGNPIMIQSGNKMQFEQDYLGKGEFPLNISRTYNKGWTGTGVFGAKWISNYGHKLSFVLSSNSQCPLVEGDAPPFYCEQDGVANQSYSQILANHPDGKKIQFTYNSTTNTWSDGKAESVQTLEQDGNDWVLTSESEFVERYDVTGKILKRTSATGIFHEFNYTNNLLTNITHSSGRDLTISYTNNKITTITDAAGNEYDYTYDSEGFLQEVLLPATPSVSKKYLYEDSRFPGALTKIRFGGSDFAFFTYHADGRGASTYHNGNIETYAFEYSEKTTTVTNPLGHESTYFYNNQKLTRVERAESTYCPESNKNVTYDSNGYVNIETDWRGNQVDHDYNAKGQLTKKTEALNTASEKVIEYQWMSGENKITHIENADSEIDYIYNAQGRLDSISETNLGSYGTYGEKRETSFSYTRNANGIVTQQIIDGPRADVSDITTYDFDSQGNLTQFTNAIGQITTYSQYDVLGNMGRMVDPNGLQTDFTYDAKGKLLSKSIANSTGTQLTQYQYNNKNLLQKITFADGNYLIHSYDSGQRLNRTVSRSGEVIKYGYNLNSDKISTTIAEQVSTTTYPDGCDGSVLMGFSRFGGAQIRRLDPCTPIIFTTEVDYYSSFKEFDAMGRLHKDYANNGQNQVFDYDNNSNIQSITDAAGNETNMTYNALNQIKTRTASDGGVTSYYYNFAGRVNQVKNDNEQSTLYYYNGFGEVTKQISPDSGTTNYTYNQSGQMTKKSQVGGSIIDYTFDALGRIKTQDDSQVTRTYHYDAGSYRKGRLYYVTDNSGNTTTYFYDKIGNVTQKRSLIANRTYNQYYVFNNMNRQTQTTYPSGHKVNTQYNLAGKASKVTYQNGTSIQNVVYNVKYRPFGPIKSFTYGNGASRAISHDKDYRTTKIYTSGIQNLDYIFDTQNNIKDIINGQDSNLTQAFIYDSENRLTRATANNQLDNYTYDKVGNRLTYSENLGQTETYSYTSNKLSSISQSGSGAETFVYNSNGQTTRKGSDNFTYNSSNRLESHYTNAQSTQFLYNALGQRSQKSSQYGTMHYLYNEAGQIVAEHNSLGTVQKEYIYLNGQVVGLIKNNTRYYVHNDHLGRAERITNQSKSTVWRASNYAFDRVVTTNSIGDYNLGFPGQYYDKETGTYYNYFRDYDPTTGRYLQSDPIGLRGGINTYSYVESNPIRYIDPTGELAFLVIPFVCAGGGCEALFLATGCLLSCSDLFRPSSPTTTLPLPSINPNQYRNPASNSSTSAESCDEEWDRAIETCEKEIDSCDGNKGITGGYSNPLDCARGLVSQRCGGNAISF